MNGAENAGNVNGETWLRASEIRETRVNRGEARKYVEWKENKNNTLSPFSYSPIPPSRCPHPRPRVYTRGVGEKGKRDAAWFPPGRIGPEGPREQPRMANDFLSGVRCA